MGISGGLMRVGVKVPTASSGRQSLFDSKAKLVIAVQSNAQAASGSAYGQELEAALAAISQHLRGR